MAEPDRGKSWTRDDQQKPGRPPRAASEPGRAAGSSRNAKTRTDPATGAPQNDAPVPNQAEDAGRS